MKRFFNVCVLLVAGFFGGLVGSSVNSAGADQAKDHEPGHIKCRQLDVVDKDGKAVVTIVSTETAHGIWVSGFTKDTTAGVCAVKGQSGSPYVHVMDYSPKAGFNACQVAFMAVDGDPLIQFAGRGKRFKSFNPLDSLDVKIPAGATPPAPIEVPKVMPPKSKPGEPISAKGCGCDPCRCGPGCDCGPKAVPAGDDEFACGRRGLPRDRRGIRGVAMQMLVR